MLKFQSQSVKAEFLSPRAVLSPQVMRIQIEIEDKELREPINIWLRRVPNRQAEKQFLKSIFGARDLKKEEGRLEKLKNKSEASAGNSGG